MAGDYPRLVNGLALAYGSFPAAEDAVQEALARAWEQSERGRHIESASAWVATTARNLLRDRFRRLMAERRARDRLAGRAEPQAEVGAADRRMDLQRALAGLPKRQREVAVFHYYLDLDVARIAALLGIPEGSVKSALHRARRSLAGTLGEPDDERMEVEDVTR